MRIAYIAPYQGPTLLQRRPIVLNRTMAGTTKIEVIATLLRANAHDVEIISQGEVVENAWKFYPSFSEQEPFHPSIPVYYASALPVRRLNGAWSGRTTLQLLKARHRAAPYDLVIIYNLKVPQLTCANYAIQRLRLPVILEYEDDRFVSVQGEKLNGFALRRDVRASARLFQSLSGGTAVSPYLLSQLPAGIPKLLLRGVVAADIVKVSQESRDGKKNVVLFSGTHQWSNGVAQLIEAWRGVGLAGWELHITGHGEFTEALRQMATGVPGIVFHGLVSRPELVRLLCSAKICMNPHQVSETPGNVFAFKIVEYLAAGGHVITTPMGPLEKELEAGITYMPDNSPETIATVIKRVIKERAYERTAMEAAQQMCGPAVVSKSLDELLSKVSTTATREPARACRK
jgi:hypothetical protein